MDSAKENVIQGIAIPKYILDDDSNLSQFFTRLLCKFGNKTAMVDGHSGSYFTFASILNVSYNIANLLKYEYGIQKSDIVGIVCENTIWYPSLMLAVWHVGGVCALFNHMYSIKELTHVLNITKPKLMITSKMNLKTTRDCAKQLDFIKYICPIDMICNTGAIEEINNFVPTKYNNDQTSVILFSSGTTGLPKGVELSHKSVFLLTSTINYIHSFVKHSDVLMGLIPMFHGYGVLVNCSCMSVGSKLIVLKYFDKELFLKSIYVQKITVLFAVPPIMIFLAKDSIVDNYDLSSLKIIYSGAAPLPKEILLNVIKRLDKDNTLKILQGYGMTELTMVSTLHDVNIAKCIHGSVGKLICGMTAKVIDLENGKPLGINKTGEICFKGPLLMKGYHKNDKETLATIDSNGWLHTGDIGYYDDDGHFYIVDRLKELIKYKGYQVAPAELEALILTHPEVVDVAVTGLPNELAGELPMAFVVKTPTSKLTEKDVINFVHGQVSAQKRLSGGVQFVNSIPKNPSGKILRRVLKELIYKSKL